SDTGAATGPVTSAEVAGRYAGRSSAATVSSTNAADLAEGGYYGWRIGEIAVYPAGLDKRAAGKAPRPLPVVLSEVLRAAVEEGLRGAGAGSARTSERALALTTTPGTCGGQRTSDGTSDAATGTFSGTTVFSDYCEDGLVYHGTVYFQGRSATAGNPVGTTTYWFRSLTLTADESLRLYGLLSSSYDDSTEQADVRLDLVLQEPTSGSTAWLEGYHTTYRFSGSTLETRMTGRYHDPDYGYVNLSTESPLTADESDTEYTSGALLFRGTQDTWVKLFFDASGTSISADTDGDGVAEWGDGPPRADAGPDRTAAVGSRVALDGSGSRSMDGSALSYEWTCTSYPAGAYPNLSGANTTSPSFTPLGPGTYVFRLTVYDGSGSSAPDTVTVSVTLTAAR
ncbi:MAG: hypothetical protein HGA98_02550, partial [Deltaproteobacteria bacterium]|nr:hypothetical protein [Deltaproteobacteria bacterium]